MWFLYVFFYVFTGISLGSPFHTVWLMLNFASNRNNDNVWDRPQEIMGIISLGLSQTMLHYFIWCWMKQMNGLCQDLKYLLYLNFCSFHRVCFYHVYYFLWDLHFLFKFWNGMFKVRLSSSHLASKTYHSIYWVMNDLQIW